MIALSAGAAILLNIGRNTYLAFHAMNHGSRSLDRDYSGLEPGSVGFSSLGTVHDFAGNAAMLLAFLVLLACVPLLNRLGRRPASPA
jgi:exosortase/archaeosortase family protein